MSHVAAVWLLLTGFCWLVSVGQNGNGPVSAAATLERNNNNNNKKKSEKQQQEGEQQLQHPIWKPHISQGALYCHLDQQKAAKMLPFRRGAAWQMLFLLCALAYCINEASSEGRVVCYYTNWSVYRPGTAKFNPQNINPYLCTHLVYAFGGFTKDNQMKPFDKYQDIEQGGYAKFTGLKTYNKQLKTMIAIGGWNEASSRFSPLVASPDRRQQFIKNILKFLRQNHFDGIDLDWEYPAHREGGKSRDRDNYAQFVQELRAEFEREAEKTGRTRLLLTMAVPAGIEYIDKGYDVPKLNKYLDWFNVLTYDFHSSHEPSVNHHAPLYSLEEDSEYNYDAELNIDYSIKYYLKAGADRDKLVLGIPTYGRSYTLINEESTELGAPSEGPGEQGDATREKGYLAYYEICQTLKDDPEWTVVQPNANVMGPYAFRRNQWVGYDDEAIVRKKAEYVVAQGLGGIMFWAIDNDDFRGTCNGKPYPLIEAAKEAMVEALGLGINEVAKPSGPQKPSRSRSRDNGSTRNRLNGKPENTSTSVRPANGARRPAVSRTTQSPPPSTTFKLTDAEGSSLYIGGRASTTPPPPTTPDPGSDFKCEEEGFFQHPRDCKKYYWCLDSGPSGLGIVAHMFTCPSGLYFNPAADSCDFARNVPCKTKKSTTVAPLTSTTTTTTTTARSNRVTAAPTARPVYPRTSSTSTSTTTTTTTPEPVEDLEYEEDTDEQSPNKSHDGEEDPQVIKELIDLIRKVGGVEQLEKHLLRNKDGSITLKENSANGAVTTPSTISKSLYDRVLSRPGTLSSLTRNRLKIAEASGTEATTSTSVSAGNTYSKYSSVLRGNSRQGPQNEGIDKLAEFDGFLKERKQYVTINRQRSPNQGDAEEHSQHEEEDEENEQVETTTRRALSSVTPSYTSLRRTRPTTMAPLVGESSKQEEEEEEVVEKNSRSQQQVKSYATLNRARERTTTGPGTTTTEATEAVPSSTTTRYKYFERTRPTKAATLEASKDSEEPADQEDEEEEYEEENITVQRKQSTNTRKYASIGRRSTTTTATPETTTTSGTETAKANNNNIHYNSNNNKNSQAKQNNIIPTTVTEESSTTALPTPTSTNQEPETTTETNTNETTEPNDRSSTTTTTNNPSTTFTSTPTPSLATTTPTTTIPGVDSESSADGSPNPLIPESPDLAPPTTTTEPELATTTTTTPKTTTPVTTTSTGIHSELNNDIDNDNDSDDSELRQPTTANVSRRPVLSVRRRIINSPASTLAATATASEATRTQIVELPATTSKYSRLRSKLPTVATTIASAAAATTNMPTTTSPTSSNSYLSKLKAKAAAAAAFSETATLTPMSGSGSSSNDVTQKQHKFQPASFALRRQFQTRRLTTFAPATNADESATEIPRTQNPLFKRRLTLISTSPPSVRTTNVPLALETTTSLYPNEDDEDQVAKSSIHTSRFNQIPDQVKHRSTFDLSPVGSSSTDTTTQAPQAQPLSGINTAIRRQLIPRPRRPQSTAATVTPTTAQPTSASTASKGGHSAPPLSRRQQSRRRPHKYIEVYSRPPSNPGAVVTATLAHKGEQGEELSGMGVESYQVAQRRRSDNVGTTKTTKTSKTRRISTKAPEEPKVIVHGRGIIECRAQGNFPHPLNCRKFISCARFEETGGIVGWEYTCPKGLTYNGVGGMCTWSPAEQVCRD
ncbi:mucin-5AC isoform X4 [Drosophila ananassae]|uniref:mucin-5AC isoform X4 n=1 Tax=Drosophila ananassae TaxID=7217 RepID=UPI001CFF6354|nr:mucin-5AC isoform X4 [Drosophila ananassae]